MPSLKRVPSKGSVGIVGAGISGLSFAYFLNKLRPDISITLFESTAKTGGWINTVRLQNTFKSNSNEDIIFEKGPRTLRGVSDGTLVMLDVVQQLGHRNQIMVMKSSSAANSKYLLDSHYQLIPVPHSFKSFAKFSGSELFSGFLRSIAKEPFQVLNKTNHDESVEAFLNRRFGSTMLSDKILSAILHGIYAGDVAKLSIKSVFPRLKEMEIKEGSIIRHMVSSLIKYVTNKEKRKHVKQLPEVLKQYENRVSKSDRLQTLWKSLRGYPIVSFRDTLEFFPKLLTKELHKVPNINIKYNSKITELDPESGEITANGETHSFDHIRCTVNPIQLARIIKSPELVTELNKIEHVSVFMANIYCHNRRLIDKPVEGFGFLVPKNSNNNEFLLGTIFDSDISSHVTTMNGEKPSSSTNSSYNLTMMLGGHFYGSGVPSTSLSLKAVRNSLAKVFNVDLQTTNLIFRHESQPHETSVKVGDKDILISYNLHADCIPQYNVGYEEIKAQVHEILSTQYKDKLSIGGMCFGNGIGVPDCVMNSLEAAFKVK